MDNKAFQKISKKKSRQERSDSQLDYSYVTTESELTSKAATGVDKRKKKNKRKRSNSERDDGDHLGVPLGQGKVSSQPTADHLGNGDCIDGGTPVKKKRAKEFVAKWGEAREVSAGFTEHRTESTSSNRHKESDHSDVEDTQEDLFTSSPLLPSTSFNPSPPVVLNEMTHTAEESCTDGFQISNSAKKKKKRKKHKRETQGQCADAGLCSPLPSDQSSIFSCRFDDQASVDSRAFKKKSRQERSDSQLDYSYVTTESELTSKAATGVDKRKKKNKRKHSNSERDDGDHLGVPLGQGKVSSQPTADHLGNGDCVDGGTPVKKKRAKEFVAKWGEAREVSAGFTEHRTESTSSNRHKESDHSDVEDTQEDLFTSSPLLPCKTQHSSHSQERAAAEVSTPAKLGSHVAPRKRRKHKKSSGLENSDTTNTGFAVEETVKSVTNLNQIKNESWAKQFPIEDCNDRLLKTPKDHPASQSFSQVDNEFLESFQLATLDLHTVTQELEEFIPHVRNLSESAIRQLAKRDLVRFKNFKQKGIAVKFGRFSEKENAQLRKNVETFLQLSGIESAEKLLFTHRYPAEREAITRLKIQHLFGIRIAEGIPRPWRLVYCRARKIFDPKNYNGRYSNKEKRKLMKYQAINGNNWKKISELMSRSSHSIAMKYSQIKSNPNSGPWSKEETKKLIRAVEEMLRDNVKDFDSAVEEEDTGKALSVKRENLYKGIPWTKVEAKVGTRHWRQCKQKWISFVTKKMSRGRTMARGSQSLRFKINLIKRLYKMNIEDVKEVDWESLSTVIGDVPPDYIQRRFYRLKTTQVPFWNQKTFPEIIDYLYEVTLQKLKALVKAKGSAKVRSSQLKEQRRVFQFKDIFQDSSDELVDDSDSDNDNDNVKAGSSTGGVEC